MALWYLDLATGVGFAVRMSLFPVVYQSWIYVLRACAAGTHLWLKLGLSNLVDIPQLLHGVFGIHLVRTRGRFGHVQWRYFCITYQITMIPTMVSSALSGVEY